MYGVNERYTRADLDIYNEFRDLYLYSKELMRLNKKLKESKLVMNKNKIDLTIVILKKLKIYISKTNYSGHSSYALNGYK